MSNGDIEAWNMVLSKFVLTGIQVRLPDLKQYSIYSPGSMISLLALMET